MSPYLTIQEAAELLRWDEQTLRNKMSAGVFEEGVHYFRRRGEMSVRFKRAVLEAWVECRDAEKQKTERGVVIPMAKGYALGEKH